MAARSARWQQFLQELVMVAGTVSYLRFGDGSYG